MRVYVREVAEDAMTGGGYKSSHFVGGEATLMCVCVCLCSPLHMHIHLHSLPPRRCLYLFSLPQWPQRRSWQSQSGGETREAVKRQRRAVVAHPPSRKRRWGEDVERERGGLSIRGWRTGRRHTHTRTHTKPKK